MNADVSGLVGTTDIGTGKTKTPFLTAFRHYESITWCLGQISDQRKLGYDFHKLPVPSASVETMYDKVYKEITI